MESWRKVLRLGFFRARRDDGTLYISDAGLAALRCGLVTNDVRLTQGSTCTPPPMQCCLNWPVEGACLIGYAAWKGDGLQTVEEVETFFGDICAATDSLIGEQAVARFLLHWFDDTPRDSMRRQLTDEVIREQERRAGEWCEHCPSGDGPCCVCGRGMAAVA